MSIVWNRYKIGAGGLLTGIDIHSDGTLVCRADVFGCYLYNRSAANPGNAGGTGVWQQLITTTSIGSFTNTPLNSADGPYEIRIAPSNSSTFYMAWRGFVWYSTNQGGNWTQTAFPQNKDVVGNTLPVAQCRVYTYHLAIDPNNPDIVYIVNPGTSSTSTGIFGCYSTSGGRTGGAWARHTDIPAVDAVDGLGLVAFDTSNGTTGGATNNIYVAVSGSGLYKSTNAGTSFAAVTGSPTRINCLRVTPTGKVYVTDLAAGTVKRLVGSTWTDITPSILSTAGCDYVAIDPSNEDHIIAFSFNSGLAETTSASTTATWTPSVRNANSSVVATDVPWLATLNYGPPSAEHPGSIVPVFDTLDNTKIWLATQQGIFQISTPVVSSPTAQVYTSFSSGIEELVSDHILVSPGQTSQIFCSGDVGILQNSSPTTYPTAQKWNTSVFLDRAFWADYAKNNSSFICALVNQEGPEATAFSSDAGTTWTAFSGIPAHNNPGGSIACASSSNMVRIQSNRGDVYYTKDGGTTWSLAAFSSAGSTGPIATAGTTGTTLTSSANAGATSLSVAASSNIVSGGVVEVNNDGSAYNVTNLVGTTVTISPGLAAAAPNSSPVFMRRTLTTAASSGATSLSLTTTTGLISGCYVYDASFNPYQVTGITGATPGTLTISPGLVTAASSGTTINAETGWGFAYYLNRRIVTADTVNIGTFYAQNAGVGNGTGAGYGTWRSTDGGANWSMVSTNNQGMDLGAGSKLMAVPGNAGHLFFTSGSVGSGFDPASNWPHSTLFYHSQDGGQTWVDVSSLSSGAFTIREVWYFGIGASASPGGYPAIYIYGWVNAGSSPSPAGSTPAFYMSTDHCVTWTQIGSQYPIGWPDTITCITAHPDIFGRIYVGYQGSSYIYSSMGAVAPIRLRWHV